MNAGAFTAIIVVASSPLDVELNTKRFVSSGDATLEILRDTGHSGMLERTAPEFRGVIHRWLEERGF